MYLQKGPLRVLRPGSVSSATSQHTRSGGSAHSTRESRERGRSDTPNSGLRVGLPQDALLRTAD